jgi:streptogramin lyase
VGAPIAAGRQPFGIAFGAGSVWVAMVADGVIRIDPRSGTVTHRWAVGKGPDWLDANAGAVWVPVLGDGNVTRIDPRTNRIVGRPIHLGGGPDRTLEVGGVVWVADFHRSVLKRIKPD